MKNQVTTENIIPAIAQHNAGRDPQLLAQKYRLMAQSPFVFLRGACHLFYTALPESELLRTTPLAWCCGDLHFENFGSYKGDNQQVYFDINDYDESALAPLTWDILRLLTSLQCGADVLKTTTEEAQAVSATCLTAYRDALLAGKPLWVEQETSKGLVYDLLESLQTRENSQFLDKRTVLNGRKRRFIVDGSKGLPVNKAEKQRVQAFMEQFAAQQTDPKFFRVLDIGRRIAGTGSLGISRFQVLVRGGGSPDHNYVLDLKIAQPSSLHPPLAQFGITQPTSTNEAQRVIDAQNRMQAVNHAFLQAVTLDDKNYILRSLQPTEDRVSMGAWGKKISRLHQAAATMGRILAWDQLRASGRSGAANADALVEFAQSETWHSELLTLARDMTEVTHQQWTIFTAAWRDGQFK
jgi:uncharacterized protein (DUF2252 family)